MCMAYSLVACVRVRGILFVGEHIIEPREHDISADIVRMWLSIIFSNIVSRHT
jgi:hypothetical protein